MRCYICDKVMSDNETQFSVETKAYEPCATCMEIILDAAYCDGFIRYNDEEEIAEEDGAVEVLAPDVFVSSYEDMTDRWSRQDYGDPGYY